MRYVVRRLLHGAVLLVAVSFFSFALAQLAPGDYYSEMRSDPRISAETVAVLRAQAGADRPLLARYATWVAGALHGDWGQSLSYHGPVAPLLRERVGATLLLTATSAMLAWIVAVPLGIWSAARRGTRRDGALRVALAFLLSAPDLLLAIVLLLLAVQTGWFPAGGKVSRGFSSMGRAAQWRDLAWHMALPVAVLVAGLAPMLARHVRAAMLEAMDAPFAWSARAQGIPRLRLLIRHLLPAALNPLISLFGFSVGTLLSASLIVEVVMGWPGLGPLFLDAIMARDFAVVLAVVMLSTVFLLLGNLLADLLLYRADPRIRMVNG